MKFIFSSKSPYSVLFYRKKSYKHTLNTPKFSLPIKFSPLVDATNVFDSISKYYNRPETDKNFVLHDGPPYANGSPHAGHALNKILKDILLQYKRLQGYNVSFIPGWDCHGLPIEMKSSHSNPTCPIDIRAKSSEIAKKYVDIQKTAFKSWGVSADWDNKYATFDFSYQCREIKAFGKLYDKNLIFRDSLPTFWSCSSKTALAESELEYNENHHSKTLFVKFHLLPTKYLFEDYHNISLLIWTTTPWTLIANEAVGINRDMKYLLCERHNSDKIVIGAFALEKLRQMTNENLKVIFELSGNDLIGCHYQHPLISNKTCTVFAADFVTENKGTGLVHIAPAHGNEDFQLMKFHNEYHQSSVFVTDDGKYTDNCGKDLRQLDIFKSGLDKVISLLGSNILHIEDLIHSYPYDWRTKKPVIIRLSTQWFIDAGKLSDHALSEYEKINVYPPTVKGAMLKFISNRPNWCISRQRKWGVPIPVLYDEHNKAIVDIEFLNYISSRVENEGSDFWWSDNIHELVPEKYFRKWDLQESQLRKSEDIFDIWFDSGLSWYCSKVSEKAIDIYIEGMDQFRGWFSSSLLMGVALKGSSPYKNLVCHGFTVDGEGKKMSKSIGNVVDPADVIQRYGIDVLRYWACSSGLKPQSCISNSILDNIDKKYFSLRNMFRFLIGNCSNISEMSLDKLSDPNLFKCLLPQDRYILHAVRHSICKIESYFDNHQYDMVISSLEELESKISNFYFTIIKDRLYCDNPSSEAYRSCNTTLGFIFHSLISVCLPIFPCLILEIVQSIKQFDISENNLNLQWPSYSSCWLDKKVTRFIEDSILPLKNDIININFAEHGIILSNKTNPISQLSLDIFIGENENKILMEAFNNNSYNWEACSPITEIFRCSSVKLSNSCDLERERMLDSSNCFMKVTDIWIRFIKKSGNHKCSRCRRYTVTNTNIDLCSRCLAVIDLPAKSDLRVSSNK